MTFAAHAVMGAGLMALPAAGVGGNPTVGVILGSILGSLPDTLDWLLWKLGVTPRWSVYRIFHHEVPEWVLIVLYPLGTHVWTDRIVHLYPGYNWWPRYWWLEVGMWLCGGFMIAMAYLL